MRRISFSNACGSSTSGALRRAFERGRDEPEPEEHMIPDSSLRYLLSIDQRTQQCALKVHLDFA